MDVEATRIRYRPERITTLFVGESAPASGDFFYYGNTMMMRSVKRAMDAAGLRSDGDFFEYLKQLGWYLDDLVLTPVDKLAPSERQARCAASEPCLAERIAKYRPQAVVTLLKRIKPNVDAAMAAAGCSVPHHVLPFPGPLPGRPIPPRTD